MNRLRTLALGILLLATACSANEPVNLDKGVALHGYDAVSYFSDSGPQKGKADIRRTHAGATYQFASESNAVAFAAAPEKYLPAYGGYCAYAMLDGDKVDVDPKSYKLVDGRLLLFYDGLWGDTRKQWNEKSEPESTLIQQADGHWERLQRKP